MLLLRRLRQRRGGDTAAPRSRRSCSAAPSSGRAGPQRPSAQDRSRRGVIASALRLAEGVRVRAVGCVEDSTSLCCGCRGWWSERGVLNLSVGASGG